MSEALALTPHPIFAPDEFALRAEVIRSNTALTIRYVLKGPLAALAIPSPAAPARADELWRHTCFEAFLRSPGDLAYREFNFSPSTRWAAYRFRDYRAGMADLDIPPPAIAMESGPDHFGMNATFLPDIAGLLHIGLSAILEHRDGAKSYWALAHPPGDPDFHHPDCFALELPAPETP